MTSTSMRYLRHVLATAVWRARKGELQPTDFDRQMRTIMPMLSKDEQKESAGVRYRVRGQLTQLYLSRLPEVIGKKLPPRVKPVKVARGGGAIDKLSPMSKPFGWLW